MGRITPLRRWIIGLVAALAALTLMVGAASAAPAAPEKPAARAAALSRQLKREQERQKIQAARLDRATEHAAKLDALVAKLKTKGRDTTALEQAIAAYRSAIEQARTELTAAADALSAHVGFDADGKVTNADQARATLKAAHDHMQQVHQIMQSAAKNVRDAVRAFRKANRDTTPPAEPPTP